MTTPLENDPILHSVPIVDGHKKIDSYLLQRRLGTGGMGAVYLGRHETLGSRAAVKCLLPSASLSEDALQRFWREAQIAANIESPNLIHVHHLGESHGVHFMVMEFIDGENAEQRVGRSGPLAPREALTIIHNACRGLAAGHENDPIVVHRDIKPQNIMVSKSGDVKVADLGIARVESGEILTLDKSVFGTPNYMSPEQFEAAKDAKTASDVYSMGATLYYLLVGDHPYAGLSLAKIMKEVEVGFPDIAALRPRLAVGSRRNWYETRRSSRWLLARRTRAN
jgi:serine/threonine protein kinase